MTEPRHSQKGKTAKVVGGFTEYDRELLRAKKLKLQVSFTMFCEAPPITDDDGVIVGIVLYVDRFDVKVEKSSGDKFWLSKLHILGTQIHELQG